MDTPKATVQKVFWHARCRKGRYGYMVFIGADYPPSVLSGVDPHRSATKAWRAALCNTFTELLTR